jgi:arogenate dehydrogenase (NADP+)
VVGVAHRQSTVERALERGLVDDASSDLSCLKGCGLVLLALPLNQLVQPKAALLQALPPEALVLDTGSVKQPVLAAWQPQLPRFVGCHPMAGTAEAGVEAGVAGLFQGRPWVITPSGQESTADLEMARALGQDLGSTVLECDPADHDRAVAFISHMPVLVSAALLQSAAAAEPQGLLQALASSGFADTTRIGGGNPELGSLMARCNREAVQQALAAYSKALHHLAEQVEGEDWTGLHQALASAQAVRPPFL